MKRNSTDRKMHREEIVGERFPIRIFGTRLGAAHEDAPFGRVKAIEMNDECALIRVVPPVFRSLWGFGCRCFLSYRIRMSKGAVARSNL